MNAEDIQKAERAIDMIADGAYLADAIATCGLTRGKFRRICSAHPSLDMAYAQATEIRVDVEVDEITRISDDASINPHQARNMIDARKWRASRLYRKKYGDSITMEVNQTVDISGALIEARRRTARLNSDSQQIEEAQVIDSITLPINRNPVLISVDQDKEPFINPFQD